MLLLNAASGSRVNGIARATTGSSGTSQIARKTTVVAVTGHGVADHGRSSHWSRRGVANRYTIQQLNSARNCSAVARDFRRRPSTASASSQEAERSEQNAN